MKTLLRITFKDQDFIIQILSDKPSIQSELEVLHRGVSYTFIRKESQWTPKEYPSDPALKEEFQQIAFALALRFRGNTAKSLTLS